MFSNVRKPAVAGMFYPGSEESLNRELENLLPSGRERIKAFGVLTPHAGYVYSGGVAGEVFASVYVPKKVILLGPNHTGLGARASIMTIGEWALPNGKVPIDGALAEKIMERSSLLHADAMAHLREHSLEVQLPFLLHESPDVGIVPVTLMGLDVGGCREVGLAIAEAVKTSEEEVLVVASSDMTHYESKKSAEKKDGKAIERILALDPEGLMKVVEENDISMCGVIPATIMLFAAKELGAEKASLLKYATSGDVTGDYEQVVGYAGVVVE